MSTPDVPDDWYRRAYPPEMVKLPWAQKTGSEVDRVLRILQPAGDERILDLGCGTGRHALELTRRGFSVVGVELLEANVAVAEATAAEQALDTEFVQADLRELEFDAEFDVVLSLNDGAIGYFESEDDNMRTFEVIARALRPGSASRADRQRSPRRKLHADEDLHLGRRRDRTARSPLERADAVSGRDDDVDPGRRGV